MRNDWTILSSLLGLGAAALLGGCGSSGPSPHLQGVRPGAERTAPVLKALPPPDSGRPHEAGVAPADETRGGPALGSTVHTEGGQKAQKEEAEKQAAEQSRKDRERAQRAAEARKAKPPAGSPAAEPRPAEQSPAPVEASPPTPPPSPPSTSPPSTSND